MQRVEELRNTYRACIKIADETDSKKEDAMLRADAKEALEELKKICTHDWCIMTQRPYNGDYDSDYSNTISEYRRCLFCNVFESSYSGFAILNKPATIYLSEDKYDQAKRPLLYLLSEISEVIEKNGRSL